MENSKENKDRHIDIRVSASEYDGIHNQFKKSTYRKLADYARKVLLGKPIVSKYRNQSLDDFMAEMILLRNDLSAIGNNFNQAVKKLHSLDHPAQMEQWVMATEQSRNNLQQSVDAIEKHIGKIADQWLQ